MGHGPALVFKHYNTVFQCAKSCGFTHGHYENSPGDNRDHWHLQIGPANYRNPDDHEL